MVSGENCALEPTCNNAADKSKPVTCAGCKVSVHRACYGLDPNSASSFTCDHCAARSDKGCALCPSRKGALKQTTSGEWVHIICVLYMPLSRIDENVSNISVVDVEKETDKCSVCMWRGYPDHAAQGACIKCNAQGCNNAMHVTCAQRYAQLVCPFDETDDEDMSFGLYGYCRDHARDGQSAKRKATATDAGGERKRKRTEENTQGEVPSTQTHGSGQKPSHPDADHKRPPSQIWTRQKVQQAIEDFVQQQASSLRTFLESHVTLNEEELEQLGPKLEEITEAIRVEDTKVKALETEHRELRILQDILTGRRREDKGRHRDGHQPQRLAKALLLMAGVAPDIAPALHTPEEEEQFIGKFLKAIASQSTVDSSQWLALANDILTKIAKKG